MSIIYKYTAGQAVEDGVLHEVGDISKEAGFSFPVRVTSGVYNLVCPTEEEKALGQSFEGRLWDVLTMARFAIKKAKDENLAPFEVIFQVGKTEKQKVITMWAALDTTSGPAIHILLPSEY